jgi:hypothetical protein
VLHLEDLGTLLDSHPQRLIIGTGAFGHMRPDPGLGPELAARGVTIEMFPTAAAVDRINDLLQLGSGGWAGALHLTCREITAARARPTLAWSSCLPG